MHRQSIYRILTQHPRQKGAQQGTCRGWVLEHDFKVSAVICHWLQGNKTKAFVTESQPIITSECLHFRHEHVLNKQELMQ